MNENGNLLKAERLNEIHAQVNEQGRATVLDLSERFGVSEATIRRDLEELHSQGLLRRTHGGAVRAITAPREPPMIMRLSEHPEEKARIGAHAAGMIKDGETIFLGSGTTVLEVARHLPSEIRLTVITNSLPVVNQMVEYSDVKLIVIGGMLRQSELSMVGHVAEHAVGEFRADRAFMGMYAIDTQCGFTNEYPPELLTDRAILSIARQVVILADNSKFGRVSSMLVSPIQAAHVIITDTRTPQDYVDELRQMNITVIQV